MSINQNFPTIRPTLNLNFARSKTLDPRITFERSSTATYVGAGGRYNPGGNGGGVTNAGSGGGGGGVVIYGSSYGGGGGGCGANHPSGSGTGGSGTGGFLILQMTY